MIVDILGSTKSPIRLLSEAKRSGIPFVYANSKDKGREYQYFKDPNLESTVLVICPSLVTARGILRVGEEDNEAKFLILVSLLEEELYEYEIKKLEAPISKLKQIIEDKSPSSLQQLPFRKHDCLNDVMNAHLRPSVVQMLHQSFYSIRDKEIRNTLRTHTLMYLAGKTRVKPNLSPYKAISAILEGDLCYKLRSAIQVAVKHNGDVDFASKETGIDRFDIAYVLAVR